MKNPKFIELNITPEQEEAITKSWTDYCKKNPPNFTGLLQKIRKKTNLNRLETAR